MVAAATSQALQNQEGQINAAHALQQQQQAQADLQQQQQQHQQQQQQLVNQQLATSSDHKVATLADTIKAMKEDEAAQLLLQASLNAKLETDRLATDVKISNLESQMQDAVASIKRQLADANASTNASAQRIEAVASNLTAAATAAAAAAASATAAAATAAATATATQQTRTDAQFASVLAMLSKLTGTEAPAAESPAALAVSTAAPTNNTEPAAEQPG